MNQAIIRSVRIQSPAIFPSPLPSIRRKVPTVRFQQVVPLSGRPQKQGEEPEDMEKPKENPNEKTGNVMSHSFGEGYSTRSDEEGFGGIYNANQSLPKDDDDKDVIHENHPAYDKSQGSEVKEKEKARHQTNAC